jgi:hypothetical protein
MSIKTTRQRKNRICARQGKHHLFQNRSAEDAVALLPEPRYSKAHAQGLIDDIENLIPWLDGTATPAQAAQVMREMQQRWRDVYGQDTERLAMKWVGEVKGAFHRSDIGGIDLAWGNDAFGPKHIIKQREDQGIDAKQLLSGLSEVIEKGSLDIGKKENFELTYKGKTAVITQTFKGEKMQLLLTAFKTRRK